MAKHFTSIALPGGALLVFVAFAGTFAAQQSIWVDETTQLSGLRLPFDQLTRWLAGVDLTLGVPPDRMPPLSYYLGKIWQFAFGNSEISMRWFGIASIAAAAPAILKAGSLVSAQRGGFFALALFSVSPAIMIIAGEIRSYPLLFCFASWATLTYVQLIRPGAEARKVGAMVMLGVWLLAASYTHFFGVVAAGAIFASLFAYRVVYHHRLVPLLAAGGIFAIGLAPLTPFVLAALKISGSAGEHSTSAAAVILETARLVARLVAPPALLAVPFAFWLATVSTACLALSALWCWVASGRRLMWQIFLLVPLLFAGILLAALRTRIVGFDVLSPNYNLWMLPLVGLCLVSAADISGRLGCAALLAVVLSLAGTSATVLRNAAIFSHGPGEWLYGQIENPFQTAVVYSASSDPWGHLYFPLYFLSEGDLSQFLRRGDQLYKISTSGLDAVSPASLLKFASVLEVRVATLDSQQIAEIVRGISTCSQTLANLGGTSPKTFCALISVRASEISPGLGLNSEEQSQYVQNGQP